MKLNRFFLVATVFTPLLVTTGADCEIKTNPLIFDGATAVMAFQKTDTTYYSGGAEVD